MKTVLYIGNFFFPLGNAAGKRVYANGKVFRELGYKVIFIGQDNQLSEDRSLKSTENIHDGFYHYTYSYPKSNVDWFKYKKAFKMLVDFVTEENLTEDLDFVVFYGSPRFSLFNKLLIKYFEKKNIKTIADSVDWLSTNTNNIIFNIVKTFHYNYQNMYINKRADGVIAISKYLEAYYKKSGQKTVVIPALSPVLHECVEVNDKNDKVIAYAGIPFRKGQAIKDLSTLKDRIDLTIILLFNAKEKGANFIFNIYGFNKDEYLEAIPSQKEYVDRLGTSIIFHGLKPNNEVTKEITKADFTILIRDVNRETTAGFPTKISESISYGTPVITTKTSDLDCYIIDGENGVFIDISNFSVAVDKVTGVLLQEKEDIINMKKKCLESGPFDYKKYVDSLSFFIGNL